MVKFVLSLVLLTLSLSTYKMADRTKFSSNLTFIDEKRVDNTKINKNLTVHACGIYCSEIF